MRPYYNDATRLQALSTAIKSWIGTPWVPYSQLKGVGVSCHQLCAALYAETGLISKSLEMNLRGYDSRQAGAAVNWINARPEFQAADGGIFPGDLLVMVKDRLHMAVGAPHGTEWRECVEIAQCMGSRGVQLHSAADPTIGATLIGVWRPIQR